MKGSETDSLDTGRAYPHVFSDSCNVSRRCTVPASVQYEDESAEQKSEQIVKLATRIEEAGGRLVKILIERRFGRQGYTRGGLGFVTVVPPDDDKKGDDPLELAELAAGIAEDEASKHPEARHFRITLLAMDGSQDPSVIIGKPLIYEAQSAQAPDDKAELTAMQRAYIGELHNANVRLANANASVAEGNQKVTAAAAQLVTSAMSGSSNLKGDHMVKLAELMIKEKGMDLDHQLAQHKTDKGFELLKGIVGDIGPAMSAWIVEKLGGDSAKMAGPFAKRLDAIISSVAKEKLAEAKTIVGDDAWKVLESMRKAKDDAVFKAQGQKLIELWAGSEAEIYNKLGPVIGPDNLMALGLLFKAAGLAE